MSLSGKQSSDESTNAAACGLADPAAAFPESCGHGRSVVLGEGKKRISGKLKTFLQAGFIFAFAFLLRYLYNAVFMEHRIAHFGDAYNFLRSGSCLLQAVYSSGNLFEFLEKIYHAAPAQAQILQSMTSMNLSDRLLIDGPVFPAYLAFVQFLSGVDAFKPVYEAHTVQICLCNALLDSASCLLLYFCGRLAFNRQVAFWGALLFAAYPAAIINTQHCYSEPFSYFLLNLWTLLSLSVLLRHKHRQPALLAIYAGIGVVSGLLMLSKPAFIILPPLVAGLLLAVSALRLVIKESKKGSFAFSSIFSFLFSYLGKGLSVVAGLALVLTPWAFFNKAASGNFSVFVNRVPSFNIFHGNQISTDGWRCYPFYGTFPGDSAHVIAQLFEDAKQQPLTFLGLQLKKIARLWSGVWNEYHYSLFGIPLEIQSLFHQVLLALAGLGLAYLIFKPGSKTLSLSFRAALLLACIVFFHFAYIPFEAISRYAITAMPAVCLLAAAYLLACWKSPAALSKLAAFGLACPAVFFALANEGRFASFLASVLPPDMLELSPYLAASLAFLLIALLACFASRSLAALLPPAGFSRLALALPVSLLLLTGAVSSVYTVQSFDWREWRSPLAAGSMIKQEIFVPEQLFASRDLNQTTAFVLVDLSSDTLAPPLRVKVNGNLLDETAFPLARLQPNNQDILQCLAIQAEGMALDVRSFRNWWVLPFSAKYLHTGPNVIELELADQESKLLVYGDYPAASVKASAAPDSDGPCYLPSLRSFSYTKGFTTFDHRDPRVFEKLDLLGKSSSSLLIEGASGTTVEFQDASGADLSLEPGRQYGKFRVRIMLPASTGTSAVPESKPQEIEYRSAKKGFLQESPAIGASSKRSLQIVASEAAHLVKASDPLSFRLNSFPLLLSDQSLSKTVRFEFEFSIRSLRKKPSPGFVSLNFSGIKADGSKAVWNSKWQPIAVHVSNKFRTVSFSDQLPSQLLDCKNLQMDLLFSPFQPDFLFLKRKQALKEELELKDVKIEFKNELDLPEIERRQWQVI